MVQYHDGKLSVYPFYICQEIEKINKINAFCKRSRLVIFDFKLLIQSMAQKQAIKHRHFQIKKIEILNIIQHTKASY